MPYFSTFMRFYALVFIAFMLLSIGVAAQLPRRSAARQYNKALHLWTEYEKDEACARMKKAIRKDPSAPDAYAQLGQWYYQRHLFLKAKQTFAQAFANCKDGKKRFALPFARCLLANYQPDSALMLAGAWYSPKDSAEWHALMRNAEFMRGAMRITLPTWPRDLGVRINSGYPEQFPVMGSDTGTLYFTRRLRNMDEDIYIAHKDTCGEWLEADNCGDLLNTANNESGQFISADGHYLIFARSDNRSNNGWSEGGTDLFMSWREAIDSPWSIPLPFGATINSPYYEGMPSLSPDNNVLYFASDRPGGYGGMDIWISYHMDGVWQLPVNAGPEVNTPGNETAPFISLDNRTLYFTSDGWPGMGGKDLFVSHRLHGNNRSNATNLGYPVNTANEEESACTTPDGHTLIFASDRDSRAGDFDLFQTGLSTDLLPAPVTFVQGYVYDSTTHTRLNSSSIYFNDLRTGDTLYHISSNRGDATYFIPLPIGHSYIMHTGYVGYTDVDDTFTIDKQYIQPPLMHNVAMLPLDYVAPVHDSLIAVVHFNVNEVELSDADKDMIHAAILPFVNDKGLIIYVNAYTDNTGTPMINEELSVRRANMVGQYINSIGVDETSVKAAGWGEAKTIAPNETEEGRRANRRVEIILNRG